MTIPGLSPDLRGEKKNKSKFEETNEEGWMKVESKKEKKKRLVEKEDPIPVRKSREAAKEEKRQETSAEVSQILELGTFFYDPECKKSMEENKEPIPVEKNQGKKNSKKKRLGEHQNQGHCTGAKEVPTITDENFPPLGVLKKSSVKAIQKPNEARQRKPEEAAVKIAEKSLEKKRLENNLMANRLKVINIRRKKAPRKPEETAVKIAEESLEEERLDTSADLAATVENFELLESMVKGLKLINKRKKAEKKERQRKKKALRNAMNIEEQPLNFRREIQKCVLKQQIETLQRLRLPHQAWCTEQLLELKIARRWGQDLLQKMPIRGGWSHAGILKGGMPDARSSSSTSFQLSSSSQASCQTSPNQSYSKQPQSQQAAIPQLPGTVKWNDEEAPFTSRSRRSNFAPNPLASGRRQGQIAMQGLTTMMGLAVALNEAENRKHQLNPNMMTKEDLDKINSQLRQMVEEDAKKREEKKMKKREKEEEKKKKKEEKEEERKKKKKAKEEEKKKKKEEKERERSEKKVERSMESSLHHLKISGNVSKLGLFLLILIFNYLLCRM